MNISKQSQECHSEQSEEKTSSGGRLQGGDSSLRSE